jgi:molecular chaperone DnaK (HSP70)
VIGIRQATAGQTRVRVTFSIDKRGKLKVSAEDDYSRKLLVYRAEGV